MPWLWAIASKIGDSMASLEWQLFYIKGKQDPKARKAVDIQRASFTRRKSLMHERRENDQLVQVTTHVMLDALDSGNGYFTGREVRKLLHVFLELTGGDLPDQGEKWHGRADRVLADSALLGD